MLAKLIELKAPQAIIDQVAAGRERTLTITVADDEASEEYLSFIVRPDEGLLIGYQSARHEESLRPLVERCARSLGYEIVIV